MNKRKFILGAVILLIIGIFIGLNLLNKGRGASFKVEVRKVRKGPIRSLVRAEGELKAINQVEIGADVMGRIVELRVHEGDKVDEGDTLLLIDPKVYEAKLKQTKARLDADLSRLKKIENDLKRTKELKDLGLVSQATYEEILTQYESLRAQVTADSFALEEAREDLRKTVITSPIDGEVVAVYKEEGEMVVVGTVNVPGSVIMVIADRSKMLVSAWVDETEVVKIEPGQEAIIKVDAFPDSVFEGEVTTIGGIPRASAVTAGAEGVSYPIEIEIRGNTESLYPGMSATADIIVAKKDTALVIPFSAVGRRELEGKLHYVVFLMRDGKAEMVPVELGISSEREVEVLDGLLSDDTIIVGPYKVLQKLKNGDRVVPIQKRKRKFPRRS